MCCRPVVRHSEAVVGPSGPARRPAGRTPSAGWLLAVNRHDGLRCENRGPRVNTLMVDADDVEGPALRVTVVPRHGNAARSGVGLSPASASASKSALASGSPSPSPPPSTSPSTSAICISGADGIRRLKMSSRPSPARGKGGGCEEAVLAPGRSAHSTCPIRADPRRRVVRLACGRGEPLLALRAPCLSRAAWRGQSCGTPNDPGRAASAGALSPSGDCAARARRHGLPPGSSRVRAAAAWVERPVAASVARRGTAAGAVAPRVPARAEVAGG